MLKFAKIYEIFESFGVDVVGSVRFGEIENHILNTRSKGRIAANAKSVIVAAFCYNSGQKPVNMAKYAAVKDYHIVCNDILEKVAVEILKMGSDVKFAHFADVSPLPEVHTAAMLGLGVRGKNNLLITEKYGSYINIGSLFLDEELDEYSEILQPGSCSECGKCFEICPTSAISKNGFVRELCISNITYKKHLNDQEVEVLKGQKSVLGCDLCQDCCPHNSGVKLTKILKYYEDIRERYDPCDDTIERLYGHPYCSAQIKRNFDILNQD